MWTILSLWASKGGQYYIVTLAIDKALWIVDWLPLQVITVGVAVVAFVPSDIVLPVTSDVCCVGGWRANSTTASHVDDDQLPFSEMVLKFADKVKLCYLSWKCNCTMCCIQATHIAQRSIVAADKRRIPEEDKQARVSDVLKLILPNNAVLHIAFPIHR